MLDRYICWPMNNESRVCVMYCAHAPQRPSCQCPGSPWSSGRKTRCPSWRWAPRQALPGHGRFPQSCHPGKRSAVLGPGVLPWTHLFSVHADEIHTCLGRSLAMKHPTAEIGRQKHCNLKVFSYIYISTHIFFVCAYTRRSKHMFKGNALKMRRIL